MYQRLLLPTLRLVLDSSHGFLGKTKIEDLAWRYLFGNAQALFSKIDSAAHPSFIEIAKSPKPAHMEVVNLCG